MRKFIQNTTNISWALFGILTLLIVCGHDGPMDLKNLDPGTQVLLEGWAISLIAATLLSCFQFMAWCRGKGKPEHF